MRPPQRPRRRRQIAGHRTRSTPPASSRQFETVPLKAEPRWWVRDILVAGTVAVIVGAASAYGTVVAQQRIDDARADRELRAANLTFVRERSSDDPLLPRPFMDLDLRGKNLSGLDLRNADFTGANLSGTQLLSANLAGSDMESVDLSGADAYYANLADVDLIWADLFGAFLNGADLSGADLISADLSEADLHGADLRGAVLYGAKLSDADLSRALLVNAELTGADLSGADLRNADLTGVCWKPRREGQRPEAQWPQGFFPPPHTDASCKVP